MVAADRNKAHKITCKKMILPKEPQQMTTRHLKIRVVIFF
jgi:hypothetical protein